MTERKVPEKAQEKQGQVQPEILPPDNQAVDQFALAKRTPSALAADAPPTVDDVMRDAERQIEIFRGYVKLVARFVQPEDILVFGDQVYLPAKPCQDILSWARITVRPHWPVQETHYKFPDGDAIEFTVAATITDKSGRSVEVLGNRSTRDEFFGSAGKDYRCPQCDEKVVGEKVNGNWQNRCKTHGVVKPKAVTRWLPLQDVDIPSVRKAAVTNLWNTALGAVGLRPTLKDLSDAGMDIKKVKRVDFKSDRQESSVGGTGQRTAGRASAASQPQSTGTAPQTHPAGSQSTAGVEAGWRNPQPSDKGAAASAPQPKRLWGNLQNVYVKMGSKGEFLTLKVSDKKFYMFDNRTMMFGRDEKPIFDALLDATGEHVDFLVEESVKGDKKYLNATKCLRVGDFEWLEDGTPVLRRDTPREANNPDITDEDIGI